MENNITKLKNRIKTPPVNCRFRTTMKQDDENMGSDLGQARINSKQQADQNRYN